MASNDKVTLQNIQDYANKYFPDEFAKLPLVEDLVWVPASQTRTTTQWYMKIALVKLRIGGYKDIQSTWAHKELDQSPGGVYMLSGGQRILSVMLPHIEDLCHPFKAAYRQSGYSFDMVGPDYGFELKTLIEYYFLLKGAIPPFKYPWAMDNFEWAVRSVANGAPLNNVPTTKFSADVETRMRSIQTMLPSAPHASAMLPAKIGTQGRGTSLTEDLMRTVKNRVPEEIEGTGTTKQEAHHTDRNQMKKLFKDQKDARRKIDEDMAATSAQKEAHIARIQVLENELSEAQAARKATDGAMAALHERHKQMQKLLDNSRTENEEVRNKLKTLANSSVRDARVWKQRVRADQNRRSEAEAKLKEECARKESRWEKAQAFYTNQKELLEIQVAECPEEEKESIMEAFKAEYGELCPE
ncbi:uncharacterized protein J4E78_001158 [Alternaria triticimaculans]|uniref:uncharacterized protein n=1 Tax=Alternaria triticimaculans TaxID=297637 RepID=UPI0020C55C7C|nr:uncharacterized protein J4E78_001158 [Alternaria triticimaculans]KAI4672657.1 hypothetical protein J4E78_001158 [Alternaria triticimaculans]